jgi:hypothetical protein
MESTIIDNIGNGVYNSPFGSRALGIGGRSGTAGLTPSSSSWLLLHRDVKLGL